MIAQTPKINAFDERGSGRISPDQLFSAGYRDGIKGRSKHPQYRHQAAYLRGHIQGYQERPTSLFNLPKIAEAPLERGWGDELLNPV